MGSSPIGRLNLGLLVSKPGSTTPWYCTCPQTGLHQSLRICSVLGPTAGWECPVWVELAKRTLLAISLELCQMYYLLSLSHFPHVDKKVTRYKILNLLTVTDLETNRCVGIFYLNLE